MIRWYRRGVPTGYWRVSARLAILTGAKLPVTEIRLWFCALLPEVRHQILKGRDFASKYILYGATSPMA